MTKEEIFAMAEEAQAYYATDTWAYSLAPNQLERFADLVAAHERRVMHGGIAMDSEELKFVEAEIAGLRARADHYRGMYEALIRNTDEIDRLHKKSEMQYIGACCLLGRLSNRVKDEEDRYCIKRALDDCAASFPGKFEVVKTSGSGWSLEPILTPNAEVAGSPVLSASPRGLPG